MRGACGHLCRFASASCSSLANSTYPFEHNLSSTRPEESCPQQAASPTSCLRAHSRTGLLWTTWSNSYKLIYQPFKPCNKTHQDSRRAVSFTREEIHGIRKAVLAQGVAQVAQAIVESARIQRNMEFLFHEFQKRIRGFLVARQMMRSPGIQKRRHPEAVGR